MSTDLVYKHTHVAHVSELKKELSTHPAQSESQSQVLMEKMKKQGVKLRESRTDGRFVFPLADKQVNKTIRRGVAWMVGGFGTLIGSPAIFYVFGLDMMQDSNLTPLILVSLPFAMSQVAMALRSFDKTDLNSKMFGKWLRSKGISASISAVETLVKKLKRSDVSMAVYTDSDDCVYEIHKDMVDGVPVFSVSSEPIMGPVAALEAKKSKALAAQVAPAVVVVPVPVSVLSEESQEVVDRIQATVKRLEGHVLSTETAHVMSRVQDDIQELVGTQVRILALDPETVEDESVLRALLGMESELKRVVSEQVEALQKQQRITSEYVEGRS